MHKITINNHVPVSTSVEGSRALLVGTDGINNAAQTTVNQPGEERLSHVTSQSLSTAMTASILASSSPSVSDSDLPVPSSSDQTRSEKSTEQILTHSEQSVSISRYSSETGFGDRIVTPTTSVSGSQSTVSSEIPEKPTKSVLDTSPISYVASTTSPIGPNSFASGPVQTHLVTMAGKEMGTGKLST